VREAIDAYDTILSSVAGTTVAEPTIARILASVPGAKRMAQDQLTAQERREEEKRLAAELQKRREEERHAQAEQRKRSVAERAASLTKIAYKRSEKYTQHKQQAETLVASLERSLALEDSAWREISKRARTARDLLGIYVKIQGELNDAGISADVDKFLDAADDDLRLEIRRFGRRTEMTLASLVFWLSGARFWTGNIRALPRRAWMR